MSRTYRRKKVSLHRVLNDYCPMTDCCLLQCSMNCKYRSNKKTINMYRRDTKKGYGWNGNAPKHFRKMLNREKRAKSNAEVRRIMIQGDYSKYSFDLWKHDAGWYYW